MAQAGLLILLAVMATRSRADKGDLVVQVSENIPVENCVQTLLDLEV
jgi:hypothetical protein